MKKEIELFYKPNQVLMVNNKEISLTQRKTYNVILHKARKELLENNNQMYFYFSITELKEKSGIKATDNWHIKKDLENLSDIKVENVKENGDWGFFRLLSAVSKEGDFLKIDLPGMIKEALIKNDYYTMIDLLVIRDLTGKYTVILYELALRYNKVEIPELTIAEFKKLTGTESYKNFSHLRERVIKPSVEEINKKTDINLNYSLKSLGRKITHIKFYIKKQNKESLEINFELEELLKLIPEKENLKDWKKILKDALKSHSFENLKADLIVGIEKADNLIAWFISSINNSHYSSHELLKIMEKKLLKEKNEKEIQKELDLKDEIEKKVNLEIENIVKNITKTDMDEFEKALLNKPKAVSKELYLRFWLRDRYFPD